MDIKIRNISDEIVAKLDKNAKSNGVSREEYLREKLKYFALDNEIKTIKEREEILLKSLTKVIDLNTKTLKVFMDRNLIDFDEVIEYE